MANLSDLEIALDVEPSYSTFSFNGKEVKVAQYLNMKDKLDLIAITMQKSMEGGIYNDLKLDMFFHLHLIYLYTDVEFSAEDREDEMKLYDALDSCGFMAQFLEHMNKNEYETLLTNLQASVKMALTVGTSAAAIIANTVAELPKKLQEFVTEINNVNPQSFQNVRDMLALASASGMNNTDESKN